MPLPSRKRTRTNESGSYRSGGGAGGRPRKAGPRGQGGQYYTDRARASRTLSRRVGACNKLSGTGLVGAISGAAVTLLKAKLGLNTEEKNVDFSFSNNPCSSILTPFINVVTQPIPLGDANNQRQGNTVRMTGYSLSLAIRNVTNNTYFQGTYVRIIGVDWGHNPAIAIASNVNDILQDPTNILSPYTDSPFYTPKKILYDQEIHLGYAANGGGADPMCRRVDIQLAPLNHHLKWTDADTTGTVNFMTEGFIQWYAVCSGFSGLGVPTIDMYSRITYVDN
nr:MAG TPA: capsid protein [Cressdnaviricota sp.]